MSLVLAAENPVGHVVNHAFAGGWTWSAHIGMLVLSALITIGIGLWLAAQVATGPESQGNDRYVTRNPFAHMLEVIAVYLRDQVVEPMLGARTAAFMPFLWTLFFFILVNNLLGLLPILEVVDLLAPKGWYHGEHLLYSPIGGTATQNLAVTGTLAVIACVTFNLAGIRELGLRGYISHHTGGVPLKPGFYPIVALVFMIEMIGDFVIKPGALAIRLFANMTAGHILLATLFMFVKMVAGKGLLLGAPVTLASCLGAFAIYFLEIFVAFLQAFVFMFLTSVFISLLSHHAEHEEHAHAH